MKKNTRAFVAAHVLVTVLACIVLLAVKQRPAVRSCTSMLVALGVIELVFLFNYFRKKTDATRMSCCDIIVFVWVLLIVWELCTSVLNLAHPVLVPCPENVFDTFREHWREMLLNVAYSMELLFIGFTSGMVLAVLLGLIAGWIPRIRNFAYPIANVMAPIPAVVFSPYLVALMPSFRSASALVIILGVFWPTFLTTINRVESIDARIRDSARMLNLGDWDMIWRVLLPYVIPGIVSGLKVSVTTSLLMLNFAELMGATHGMGYYIQNSITYANYTHAVAGIVCIAIVVTALNRLVSAFQKKAIIWR